MLKGNEKLNIDIIKKELKPVFDNHKIKSAILFGSVAKGDNSIDSDVDILVDTNLTGFAFLGLIEDVRLTLNKNVDIFSKSQIIKNSKIDYEINKCGKVIYE